MLFVNSSGPIWNSGSALMATWMRASPPSSSGIYFLMLSRATSQIVYIAALIPSTIPTSVKIGLVRSQLSTIRPRPRPRTTDMPSRSPRSIARPQFGVPGSRGDRPEPRSSLSGSTSGSTPRTAPEAVAKAGSNEEPDPDGRDERPHRKSHEHQKRRGSQQSVEDQAGNRASDHWDHHDQGHLTQDLDEPLRCQLLHEFDSQRSDVGSIPVRRASVARGSSAPR